MKAPYFESTRYGYTLVASDNPIIKIELDLDELKSLTETAISNMPTCDEIDFIYQLYSQAKNHSYWPEEETTECKTKP